MVSSLFAPSRRRRNALWRAFQRPLQPELTLAAAMRPSNHDVAQALHPASASPQPSAAHPSPLETHA